MIHGHLHLAPMSERQQGVVGTVPTGEIPCPGRLGCHSAPANGYHAEVQRQEARSPSFIKYAGNLDF